jgi:hypothetical protein
MMPRPRARGPNNHVEVVEATNLAEDTIRVFRHQNAPAAAIVTGPRNWIHMRRDPDFRRYSRFWPGGEETYNGVPVVISRTAGCPRVMATQQDLEDALLGGDE